jgi:hypothetical protein
VETTYFETSTKSIIQTSGKQKRKKYKKKKKKKKSIKDKEKHILKNAEMKLMCRIFY